MWEQEIALKLKENTYTQREKAISEATAMEGVIESLSPLTISAMDGEIMYHEEDIKQTKTFKEVSKSVGDKVAMVPLGSINTVVAIDRLED